MTEPIKIVDVWDPRATDLMSTIKTCLYCKGTTDIKASKSLMSKWWGGDNIQDVWPHVNYNRREALITGYHSSCFDLAMGPEE